MTSDLLDDDKTPILLHPARRMELLARGRDLFNDERFHDAHAVWQDLWHVENGRDKVFVHGLVQVSAHFEHLRAGNWSEAEHAATHARQKLLVPAPHRTYRELDVTPLLAALDYNTELLSRLGQNRKDSPPPVPDAFLVPKLLEK